MVMPDVLNAVLATSKLVDEPIRVSMPPSMDTKLSDSMWLRPLNWPRKIIAERTGINIKTTGVLFKSALKESTKAKATKSERMGARTAFFVVKSIRPSSAPE